MLEEEKSLIEPVIEETRRMSKKVENERKTRKQRWKTMTTQLFLIYIKNITNPPPPRLPPAPPAAVEAEPSQEDSKKGKKGKKKAKLRTESTSICRRHVPGGLWEFVAEEQVFDILSASFRHRRLLSILRIRQKLCNGIQM